MVQRPQFDYGLVRAVGSGDGGGGAPEGSVGGGGGNYGGGSGNGQVASGSGANGVCIVTYTSM